MNELTECPPPPKRSLLVWVFFSSDEPRLRAGWRLLIQVVLLISLLLAASLPLYLTTLAAPDAELDSEALGMLLAAICVTASVYICRRWLDRRSFGSLGLSLDRRTLPDLACGFLAGGAAAGFVFALLWSLGWLRIEGFAWREQSPLGVAVQLANWLFIVGIATGWMEELLSRGYWLQNLKDGLGLVWGIFLSWLIFSLLHALNPHMTPLAMLNLFLGTYALVYAWLRTRQLWLPMGLHAGWNFFLGPVFGFPVSGQETFALIEQSPQGPEWLTGHAFGPEGGLAGILMNFICMAIIWAWTVGRATGGRAMSDEKSPPPSSAEQEQSALPG